MHPLHRERQSYSVDTVKTQEALLTDATAKRILEKEEMIRIGDRVGIRLNLNVLRNTGFAVQTIHRGRKESNGYQHNKGFWHGVVIGYAEAVTLKNAFFNVNQMARELIATNQHNKFAMASIDGDFLRTDEKANLDGVEIRFNPKQTHLFVDEKNQAIRYAEEVTIVGHRAYARGKILYHTLETAPLRAGDAPSIATLTQASTFDSIKTNKVA